MADWLKIGTGGVVPVRWNVSKADTGELSGYASVFNIVDDQDEVVVPGAFKNTIARWKQSGRRLPLMNGHSLANEDVIGSFDVLKEDSTGLAVHALFASDPAAQSLRSKVIEKHINGLSIFGEIKRYSMRKESEREIRVLEEVHLMHVGLTSIPALMVANASAKSLTAPLTVDFSEDWLADMRAALAIHDPEVRKSAVDTLVRKQYLTAPAPPKKEDEPGDGAADDSADYALSLIGESGLGDENPSGGDPGSDPVADLMNQIDGAQRASELDDLFSELDKG